MTDQRLLEDVLQRVTRIESRLVQLIKYLGGDAYGKNQPGEFFDVLETRDFSEYEKPTCIRRNRSV